MNADKSKKIGKQGNVYQVQAKLRSNDSIVIAIPLDDYSQGEDSVLVEHFIEKENRWIEEPVDSVVDNYAYFKPRFASSNPFVDLFKSILVPTSITDPIEVGTDLDPFIRSCLVVSDVCQKIKHDLIYQYSFIEKGIHYGIKWGLYQIKNLICPDVSALVDIFDAPKADVWDPAQGSVALTSIVHDISKGILNFVSWKRSFEPLQKLTDPYPDNCSTELEKCVWERTRDNLDRLLADAVMAKFYGTSEFNIGWRRYRFEYKDGDAILGFVTEEFGIIADGLDCANFAKSDMPILDGHEGKLIAISEAMVRISLLAWLNKSNEFRDYTLLKYKVAYDGIRAWLELVGPLLNYNNIAIKAYASLALFEYIHYGTDENFNIDENFLKSPDYMLEFSRPVGGIGDDGKFHHYGLIPVEVDDGVTYNPDYRVWAKLKDDPKYLAMTDKYGIENEKKKNPLLAFGYPDISLYNSNEMKLDKPMTNRITCLSRLQAHRKDS